jgi:hypothetical protein
MARFAIICAAALTVGTSGPLRADDFDRVESRDEFVQLVSGRALTRFGITLNVSPEGAIEGRAFGRTVTGAWRWDSGYFCRDLAFGTESLGPNCQVVEKRGEVLRFTADEGRGDQAELRLR